jgi:hypothetical protein
MATVTIIVMVIIATSTTTSTSIRMFPAHTQIEEVHTMWKSEDAAFSNRCVNVTHRLRVLHEQLFHWVLLMT